MTGQSEPLTPAAATSSTDDGVSVQRPGLRVDSGQVVAQLVPWTESDTRFLLTHGLSNFRKIGVGIYSSVYQATQ